MPRGNLRRILRSCPDANLGHESHEIIRLVVAAENQVGLGLDRDATWPASRRTQYSIAVERHDRGCRIPTHGDMLPVKRRENGGRSRHDATHVGFECIETRVDFPRSIGLCPGLAADQSSGPRERRRQHPHLDRESIRESKSGLAGPTGRDGSFESHAKLETCRAPQMQPRRPAHQAQVSCP
jgi:hypothetical protein